MRIVDDVETPITLEQEVLVDIPHDVVLSQLGLQWPREKELDGDSICCVCPRLARWAPNKAGPLGVPTWSLMIVMGKGP